MKHAVSLKGFRILATAAGGDGACTPPGPANAGAAALEPWSGTGTDIHAINACKQPRAAELLQVLYRKERYLSSQKIHKAARIYSLFTGKPPMEHHGGQLPLWPCGPD